MGQIHEEVGKLRKGSYTKSIREDQRKPENYMIFSEESRRIIHELGNIELYELGQMSSTIQCHFCYKHLPHGLRICLCGMCLRPDEDTISKIEARFKTLIVPHYFAHINRSRGEKCGESQWHKDHWKAVDATRGANKNGHDTVTIRWQADEQHREAQLAHGWTEEYFKYFDFLKTIDIEHESQPSSSSSSSQYWWQHEHQYSQCRGHQNTPQRDHQKQDHQWQDHDWSEDLARSLKQSAKLPSEDQQEYQWKGRQW